MKTWKKVATFALAGTFFMSSCDEDLSELNIDKKNPPEVPAEPLISNAQKELVDLLTSTNVNVNTLRLWSQHWTQTTYTDESNYELIERDVNGTLFDRLYARILRDLREANEAIDRNEVLIDEQRRNQKAIIEVMAVYSYHILVDMFGDVPYAEALQGGEENNLAPVYDDQEDIYNDIIDRLDQAIANLDGESGLGAADLIYDGNTDMWKMMANSLKLRLAMRIADVNPSKAQAMAEEAYTSGVITDPANDAHLDYQVAPPNTNPLWVDLVQSNRTDFIASASLTDRLNRLDDPRRDDFFRNPYSYDSTYVDANNDTLTITVETDSLMGAPHGQTSSYPLFSQPADLLEDPTLPGTLMSHVETLFNLADAANRGFNVGGMTAQDYYEEAVRASIVDWNNDPSEATAYLSQAEVAWDAANAEELLGVQKWIAMYNRPFEAYTTYRLYDHPELAEAAVRGTTPPLRFTYPTTEYSLNEGNVRAANGGSDDLFDPIFWDVEQ